MRQAEIATLEEGQRIVRAHPHLFGSAELDRRPDADARFSTIRTARTVIPVLYGGVDYEAAASETIFHGIDTPAGTHRPRRVALEKYRSWQWSEIVTTRELALVQLSGTGLAWLGLTRTGVRRCGSLLAAGVFRLDSVAYPRGFSVVNQRCSIGDAP